MKLFGRLAQGHPFFLLLLFILLLLYSLNIHEGNDRRSPADRTQFFGIIRGYAMESATILDVSAAVGAFPADEIMPGKVLLCPMVKMPSKMAEYTQEAREEASECGRPDPMRDSEQEQEQEQEQEKTLTPVG